MKTNADFQQGKLFGLILRFSIPAALSLLITAIYNIVDRIFAVSYTHLAGITMKFQKLLFQ